MRRKRKEKNERIKKASGVNKNLIKRENVEIKHARIEKYILRRGRGSMLMTKKYVETSMRPMPRK